jgi:hypothetical protein
VALWVTTNPSAGPTRKLAGATNAVTIGRQLRIADDEAVKKDLKTIEAATEAKTEIIGPQEVPHGILQTDPEKILRNAAILEAPEGIRVGPIDTDRSQEAKIIATDPEAPQTPTLVPDLSQEIANKKQENNTA